MPRVGHALECRARHTGDVTATKCYACVHVFNTERPVLYICVDDGETVLTCGGNDHEQRAEDWKVMHLAHLRAADATLEPVDTLADGQQAERLEVGAPWKHGPIGN